MRSDQISTGIIMSIPITMSLFKNLLEFELIRNMRGYLGACRFAGIGGIATTEYK